MTKRVLYSWYMQALYSTAVGKMDMPVYQFIMIDDLIMLKNVKFHVENLTN